MSAVDEIKKALPAVESRLPAVPLGFGNLQSFEFMLRVAKMMTQSTLVPQQYRMWVEDKNTKRMVENANAIPNCMIALNMAARMRADELMVMQNLYIVEGRPGWSSLFIIAQINNCGRFSPLRFDLTKPGEPREVEYTYFEWENGSRVKRKGHVTARDQSCVAWAIELATNTRIESPSVTIEMAIAEGWYTKNGSKWQTMPEVMLRYRTASFFGKLYAPELLMGLQSAEELGDVIEVERQSDGVYSVPPQPTQGSAKGGETEHRDASTEKRTEHKTAPAPDAQPPSTNSPANNATPPSSAPKDVVNTPPATNSQGAPTLNDVLALVRKGDLDMAVDVANSLNGADQETALARINEEQKARTDAAEKPRGRRTPPTLE